MGDKFRAEPWRAFFQDLANLTGAQRMWPGPPKSTVAQLLASDSKACWTAARKELSSLHTPLEAQLWHDGWEDLWGNEIVGGIQHYLAPDTGEPRLILHTLKSSARFATEADGPKAASSMRDCLMSSWKAKFHENDSYLEAVRQMPPVVGSDNTGAAVNVASKTGLRCSARCGVHTLLIPVRHLCFVYKAKWGQTPPKPLGPQDQESVHLLTALELLRGWAYQLSKTHVL